MTSDGRLRRPESADSVAGRNRLNDWKELLQPYPWQNVKKDAASVLFFKFVETFWVVFIPGVGSCLLFCPCLQHFRRNSEASTGKLGIQCWAHTHAEVQFSSILTFSVLMISQYHTVFFSTIFLSFSLYVKYTWCLPHFILLFWANFHINGGW